MIVNYMNHTRIPSRTKHGIHFLFATVILGVCPALCIAHDQNLHERITQSAANSSPAWKQFLTDNSLTENSVLLFDQANRIPIEWMTNGAYHEDVTPRFADHFYTVTPLRIAGQAQGLTDWHEFILPLFTQNSYTWVAEPNTHAPFVPGYPSPSENTENWQHARTYEYAAMTSAIKSVREDNMGHMHYALGHILHLNQDLSQPDHTRNDEHFYPWHRWIENYGFHFYRSQPNAFPQMPHGWAYWRDQAGFNKLLDFWDRGRYMGNAVILDEEATDAANKKLGLAEFSNGNFLGEDATYMERNPSGIHYFPLPALIYTTEFTDTVTLENGKTGERPYLKKTGAGRIVNHHSARKYLAVVNSPKMGAMPPRAYLTINDPNVLQDYHSILIPKAIEYSAGILDYFFRGQIFVSADWDGGNQQYALTIVNQSGQDFGAGTFTVLKEATDGTRTPVSGFSETYPGSLADGAVLVVGTMPGPPIRDLTKFILVFKGSIGTTDPVDAGIAIAAKQFTLGCDYAPGPLRILNYADVIAAMVPSGSFPTSSDLESCGFIDLGGALNGQAISYHEWLVSNDPFYGVVLQLGINSDGPGWPQFYAKQGGWDGNMIGTWTRSLTYPCASTFCTPQWGTLSFQVSNAGQ